MGFSIVGAVEEVQVPVEQQDGFAVSDEQQVEASVLTASSLEQVPLEQQVDLASTCVECECECEWLVPVPLEQQDGFSLAGTSLA